MNKRLLAMGMTDPGSRADMRRPVTGRPADMTVLSQHSTPNTPSRLTSGPSAEAAETPEFADRQPLGLAARDKPPTPGRAGRSTAVAIAILAPPDGVLPRWITETSPLLPWDDLAERRLPARTGHGLVTVL